MSLFENIYPTIHSDIPDHIKSFQDDVYGIGGLCKAVRELLEGKVKKAIFKTGKHGDVGWIETGGFTLTTEVIEGVLIFQEGNSSVLASWYGESASDPARIVGILAANHGFNLFRQKIE